MATLRITLEQQIVENIRLLSIDKQQEVLDFVSFLLSKIHASQSQERPVEPVNMTAPVEAHPADIVERTWGNIPLDKKTAMYIAEDKELEYDV